MKQWLTTPPVGTLLRIVVGCSLLLLVTIYVFASLHVSSKVLVGFMMLTCTYLVKDFSELRMCVWVKDGKGNFDLMVLGQYLFEVLDHLETAFSQLHLAHSEKVDTVRTVCVCGTFARHLSVSRFWPIIPWVESLVNIIKQGDELIVMMSDHG